VYFRATSLTTAPTPVGSLVAMKLSPTVVAGASIPRPCTEAARCYAWMFFLRRENALLGVQRGIARCQTCQGDDPKLRSARLLLVYRDEIRHRTAPARICCALQ
jgi:hypothetical protein